MKIEIKLENPTYCNECPLVATDSKRSYGGIAYRCTLLECPLYHIPREDEYDPKHLRRPPECINRYGE